MSEHDIPPNASTPSDGGGASSHGDGSQGDGSQGEGLHADAALGELPDVSNMPYAPAAMPAPHLPRPPFWMIMVGLVGVVVSWLPLALSALGRTGRAANPRIALVQDMGVQPKFREQQTSPLYADGRAMRPGIPGTVARGGVDEDDHYYRGFHLVHNDATGKDTVTFYRGFPAQVKVDSALLHRGQQRFNIYCAVCHGMDGSGHGPVNERALELADEGASGMSWTQAATLYAPAIRREEEGNIFNTITNGVRNMPGYGAQIPIADRWAIVSYVRAIQLSRSAPKTELTQEQLDSLSGK